MDVRSKIILAVLVGAVLIVALFTCNNNTQVRHTAIIDESDFYVEESNVYYTRPATATVYYNQYGQSVTYFHPGMRVYTSPGMVGAIVMSDVILSSWERVNDNRVAQINKDRRRAEYNRYKANPKKYKKTHKGKVLRKSLKNPVASQKQFKARKKDEINKPRRKGGFGNKKSVASSKTPKKTVAAQPKKQTRRPVSKPVRKPTRTPSRKSK